jgi:hypothetical protein
MHHSGTPLPPEHIVFYSPATEHYRRTLTECRWGSMSLSPDALAAAGLALTGRELIAPPHNRLVKPPPYLMSRFNVTFAQVA